MNYVIIRPWGIALRGNQLATALPNLSLDRFLVIFRPCREFPKVNGAGASGVRSNGESVPIEKMISAQRAVMAKCEDLGSSSLSY
jgi:hypothetical protein